MSRKFLKDPRKIFFGWWLAIAAGILCLWGYAYQAYGISALFKPMSEELHFTRTATSVAASIGRFEGGWTAPVVGYLADRYGPRMLVFGGIFATGLGLALMYEIHSLWAYYVVWAGILCTGVNVALSTPLDTAIANWFIRRRGTALSIRQVFAGLSGVIGLPLVAWLIVAFGWRMSCLIGGLVMWVIGLPLAWFFIRSRRPEYYGLLPDGASMEAGNNTEVIRAGEEYAAQAGEVEFTARQALKTRAFWLLAVAYMFHGALASVMNIHLVPFLTDRGMSPVAAAAAMSVYITASIPARFFGGFLADRVGKSMLRFVMAGSYLLQTIGVTLFLFNQQSMPMLYLFFVLYGIGMGAAMPQAPVARARFFGCKAYGTILNVSSFVLTPVGVAGPIIAGWIYDSTGSYYTAFVIFAVALGLSVVIMAFASPPKPPSATA